MEKNKIDKETIEEGLQQIIFNNLKLGKELKYLKKEIKKLYPPYIPDFDIKVNKKTHGLELTWHNPPREICIQIQLNEELTEEKEF